MFRSHVHFELATSAFIFTLLTLLLACSSDSPTVTDGDSDARVLRVERFELPAGETLDFPSNYEIIAESGMDVAGDITVRSDPGQPGDFTLTCQAGTLRISGNIEVLNGPVAAPNNSNVQFQPGNGAGAAATSLDIRIIRPGGVIDLEQLGRLWAGDGVFAVDAGLVSGEGRIVGDAGGEGGSIILSAPGGQILLPDSLGRTDSPHLVLGAGGWGQNIVVKADFTTTGTSIEVVGGPGGDSGRLELNAPLVVGIITWEDLVDHGAIGRGRGGRGGSVKWFIPTAEASPDYTLPLQEITVSGGCGGDGAVSGGNGGDAAFRSGRIIHQRGIPTPPVTAIGGDGGNVFPSPLPVLIAAGGEGGSYVVLGNRGIPGLQPDNNAPVDGTDAGEVWGIGGDGGSILEGVEFKVGVGGNGGHTELARESVPTWLGLAETETFLSLAAGVAASPAGKGGSRCNGCPGGDAGRPGQTTATGGSGGNVPLTGMTSDGGRGGDIWFIDADHSANGGDGSPPGRAQCDKDVFTFPGQGGTGVNPGVGGDALQGPLTGGCGQEGIACGETETCPDDTVLVKDCWTVEGQQFQATYIRVRTCTDDLGNVSETEETWSEKGELTCPDPQRPSNCHWLVQGTRLFPDGSHQNYMGSWRPLGSNPTLVATEATIRPFCEKIDGEYRLYFPGALYVSESSLGDCVTLITYAFSGCNPALFHRNNAEDWVCCQGDIFASPRPWYVPERGTCPDTQGIFSHIRDVFR